MTEVATYSVPGMSCGHCKEAVMRAVVAVPGVTAVEVDLDTKLVSVTADALDDGALRAAIEDAGYEAKS